MQNGRGPFWYRGAPRQGAITPNAAAAVRRACLSAAAQAREFDNGRLACPRSQHLLTADHWQAERRTPYAHVAVLVSGQLRRPSLLARDWR